MKKAWTWIGVFAVCLLACSPQQKNTAPPAVIPRPVSLVQHEGSYTMDRNLVLGAKESIEGIEKVLNYTESRLEGGTGISADWETGPDPDGDVVFLHAAPEEGLGDEGYILRVSDGGIIIEASAAAGHFYGVQTLFQLMQPGVYGNNAESGRRSAADIPRVTIMDRPRFSYRGMHLDVCRHFFPVSFIKKYLDYMAMHKLNTFHWHLTEDQGWRIEIKKYPRLTEVGGWRKETVIGKTGTYDGTPYGGYYTQEDVREIVEYAADRFITVIPEIEMPGHSTAALAAYPEFSCTGGPFEVLTRWGITNDIYCAGKEKTFRFLQDVLLEVMELFPSPYIHVGGDEVPKDRWESCPLCQKRMEEEGLGSEEELQSYFIRRMETFINEHGRKLIGWDEILEGGLAPRATVMSWRGVAGGIEAASQGRDVIMVPYTHMYFDGYQADPAREPLAIGYWAPLRKVYSFNPVPSELAVEERKHVLGVQANLWTEYIETGEYAEYMVLPRMSALGEVAWSPDSLRDWDDFEARMRHQYRRYEAAGANFRIPDPSLKPAFLDTVFISPPPADCTVRYTIDGTEPSGTSAVYMRPVPLDSHRVVKARTFISSGRGGSTVTAWGIRSPLAPEGKVFGLSWRFGSGDYGGALPSGTLDEDTSGIVLSLEPSAAAPEEEYYWSEYSGYIHIPADGDWTFSMLADDAGELIIGGKRVCRNRSYTGRETQGTVFLRRGYQPLRIRYYQRGWAARLDLFWEGPGVERQPVPSWALLRDGKGDKE